jgi:hypothetical protein
MDNNVAAGIQAAACLLALVACFWFIGSFLRWTRERRLRR